MTSQLFPRLAFLLTREGMSERFEACWFSSYPPATESQISELVSTVPWISEQYLEFLRLTNGCVLEIEVVYGLGDEHPFPMLKRQWVADYYGQGNWYVAGHNGASDHIFIGRDGAVSIVGSDPPPDQPVPLCADFRTYIEEYCCGSRYADYVRNRDSDWYSFIEDRGWT